MVIVLGFGLCIGSRFFVRAFAPFETVQAQPQVFWSYQPELLFALSEGCR